MAGCTHVSLIAGGVLEVASPFFSTIFAFKSQLLSPGFWRFLERRFLAKIGEGTPRGVLVSSLLLPFLRQLAVKSNTFSTPEGVLIVPIHLY